MIKTNKVVGLSYTLKNEAGEELDRAEANDPLLYMHGHNQIVPGLELALEGLKVGDKKQIIVSPEEGYGDIDPKLRLTVKRSVFPPDIKLEPGFQFAADMGDGGNAHFTVIAVNGEEIFIDGNHPLAGETLHFDLEIISVRDATKEELSHGHAHGPGGHHH